MEARRALRRLLPNSQSNIMSQICGLQLKDVIWDRAILEHLTQFLNITIDFYQLQAGPLYFW